MAASETIAHASCVALNGSGLLITGASGQGKSGLALMLMAHGARLVADDRVRLTRQGQTILAGCPATIAGLIEARGLGLLRAEPEPSCTVVAVVDLDRVEEDRLPALRQTVLLDVALPLFRCVEAPHFPAALLQFLKAGRQDIA